MLLVLTYGSLPMHHPGSMHIGGVPSLSAQISDVTSWLENRGLAQF